MIVPTDSSLIKTYSPMSFYPFRMLDVSNIITVM